ncbi:aminotransferase class V-fold PLP-dependent enzyme [Candidatus Woesearchaeota archaeon]|nr:aminotransferase class V-fold PLP-dependent enzyme [Candidatus Woesearchaeota archaeon]
MKKDFPLLKNIAYLDNAATTQKPICVINKVISFYENSNANPHRGIYDLAVKATDELENSRNIISDFIGASVDEVFFVKNATDGFNYLANSYKILLNNFSSDKKGNIVTTIMEHHSNFVPWLKLCEFVNLDFKVANHIDVEEKIVELVDENTKIVSFTLMSNVSGKIIDAKKLIKKIRLKNDSCVIIIDAAQGIAHQEINVKDLDCDFLVFSGHKIYGPLGVGVVYGKKYLLESLFPSSFGGGMVLDYKNKEFSFQEIPHRFESGSLDVASISGLGEAIKYFSNIKDKFVIENKLKEFALSELRKIEGLRIIGHDSDDYGPVISFIIEGIHTHDLATVADSFNVCIRAGHHCAKPYLDALGFDAVSRVSLAFYNDVEDIVKLIDAIKKAKVIFK